MTEAGCEEELAGAKARVAILQKVLEECQQERDAAYRFLERWQNWARDLMREIGECPADVLPDDTRSRATLGGRVQASARWEDEVSRLRLAAHDEGDRKYSERLALVAKRAAFPERVALHPLTCGLGGLCKAPIAWMRDGGVEQEDCECGRSRKNNADDPMGVPMQEDLSRRAFRERADAECEHSWAEHAAMGARVCTRCGWVDLDGVGEGVSDE